jgi:hypothetical protein
MNQAGTRIAAVNATGMLVARASTGELLTAQQLPTKVVHRVAWSPEGHEVALATDAGPIVVRVKSSQ